MVNDLITAAIFRYRTKTLHMSLVSAQASSTVVLWFMAGPQGGYYHTLFRLIIIIIQVIILQVFQPIARYLLGAS